MRCISDSDSFFANSWGRLATCPPFARVMPNFFATFAEADFTWHGCEALLGYAVFHSLNLPEWSSSFRLGTGSRAPTLTTNEEGEIRLPSSYICLPILGAYEPASCTWPKQTLFFIFVQYKAGLDHIKKGVVVPRLRLLAMSFLFPFFFAAILLVSV